MKYLKTSKSSFGFTLIEVIVTLAISGIIMTGVYTAFKAQQDSYLAQEQVAEMQQNLRASIDYMVRNLRMAGFDPAQSDNFSITDVRSRDLNNGLDVNGNPAITFEIDLDENGTLDTNETFSYSLYEYPVGTPADQDGIVDLSFDQGGGRQLLGESIIAMGMAYSYVDAGGDVVTDGGNVVWAIDSDNDNDLDLNIDTNKDGTIDIADNPAGTALPVSDIVLENIVAVKVWLLAQTRQPDRNYQETRTYVVANQRITPNDNNRYRLMETTVNLRNMGL
jgi:type IV pilus assembly protein PilW